MALYCFDYVYFNYCMMLCIYQYQTFIGLILVLSSSLFNIFDNIYYNDTPD